MLSHRQDHTSARELYKKVGFFESNIMLMKEIR